MLQWRLLRTSCSIIFFPRVFPPLSGCAFVSLVLSKKPIHPHPHPPARPAIDPDSLPARSSAPPWPRRLSPGAAAPPRAMRGNHSQVPHTRALLRRHLRRLLGAAECVSCRGRPRHLSSLFFVSSSSWARSVASATVLQQRLLYNSWRPCAPQPKPSRSIHPPRNRSSPEDKAIHLDTR